MAGQTSGPKNGSPSDRFWNAYLNQAKDEDKFLPDSWEANTTGILTFTGLFAATVAAFLIESYKSLSPDSGDRTVALLEQLLSATANVSTPIPADFDAAESFQVPFTAVAVNFLWFSSLLMSLVCALLSTLIQEWARDYRQAVDRRSKLDEGVQDRAFKHIYVRMGIDRYRMDRVVYLITSLVHLSVLLFAAGLVVFLFSISHVVAGVAVGVLGFLLIVYTVASVLPLFDQSCPYRTPLTHLFAVSAWLLLLLPILVSRAVSDEREEDIPAHDILYRVTTRSYSGEHFLKARRFAFAWDRTSRHMTNNEEQFRHLLSSLGSVVRLNSNSEPEQFAHACTSHDFISQLSRHSKSVFSLESVRAPDFDIECFQAIATLFNGLLALDNANRDRPALDSCVNVLFPALARIGHVAMSSDNARARLAAGVCRASVAGHYFRARAQARRQNVPIPAHWPVLQLDDNGGYSFVAYQPVRRKYDATRVFSWTFINWMPLHDGDCCRLPTVFSTDDEQHAAASNALAAVALLLEADPAIRDSVGIPDWLAQFNHTFEPSADFSERLPSRQFVRFLRNTGFEEWLQKGSNFYSDSTVHDEYFSRNPAVARLLRRFAQRIDWDEHRRRLSAASSLPTMAPASAPSTSAAQFALPAEEEHPSSLPLDSSALPPCTEIVIESSRQNATRNSDSAALHSAQAENDEERSAWIAARSRDEQDTGGRLGFEDGLVEGERGAETAVAESGQASAHEDEGMADIVADEHLDGRTVALGRAGGAGEPVTHTTVVGEGGAGDQSQQMGRPRFG